MARHFTALWGSTSVHDPALLPSVLERWRAAIASGESFTMSFPLRRRDGVFRWFMTHATPLRDSLGRVTRWIGINTDIDDQRRAEAELGDAVKAREHVLAIVAHDLRNPLNTIHLGAAQLDRNAEDPVRTRKVARTVTRAVGQMNRLIDDLLDLAKIEAEQPLPLDLEKLDARELAREAVDAIEPIVSARKLSLERTFPDAPVYAVCDGHRVRQVLDNLIGNAIKFTREGGSLGVRVRRVAGDIVFAVSDTGTGIRDPDLPHISSPTGKPIRSKSGARAWACRSSRRSWMRITAAYGWTPFQEAEAPSISRCRPPMRTRQPRETNELTAPSSGRACNRSAARPSSDAVRGTSRERLSAALELAHALLCLAGT